MNLQEIVQKGYTFTCQNRSKDNLYVVTTYHLGKPVATTASHLELVARSNAVGDARMHYAKLNTKGKK